MKTCKHRLRVRLVLGLSMALPMNPGSPVLAFASLGGTVDSVQADQVRLKANIRITGGNGYTVHELTTPAHIVVREYTSPSGRVFGVAWQGPFIPEMKQLMGSYFQRYALAAKAEREGHVGRSPLNIQMPQLVVQTGGHMGAYFGRAYDPQLVPPGANPDDIR